MAVELTQEQIAAVVADAQAAIRERATRDAAEALKYAITSVVEKTLHDEVLAFIKAEIVPAVRERLTEEKPILVEGAIKGAHVIADKIAEAMLKAVTDQLSQDYCRNEILGKLFGAR